MSEIIRRHALGAALLLALLLAPSGPAMAYHGDPDSLDAPGQRERVEQEREQRERAEQERAEAEHGGPGAPGRTAWSISPVAVEKGGEESEPRTSFRMEVEPGGSADDAVTVRNHGARPATFVVYASDGIVTDDGHFDVLPASSRPTGVGSWLRLGTNAPGEPVVVEIDAESDVTLPIAIDVPADATPGDHPAGVVAALATQTGGVAMESRVGARIHLRVAGDLEPALAVAGVSATYEASWNPFTPGTLHLEYQLANTGNVRLGVESAADGASVLGAGERSGPGTAHREIPPGRDALSVVTLENVWPLLRYSGEIRTVPLVVGDDVIDVPLVPGTTAWSTWTVPWTVLAALGLVLLAVVLRRRVRRRRESSVAARIAAAVAQARTGNDGDDGEPGAHTGDVEDAGADRADRPRVGTPAGDG